MPESSDTRSGGDRPLDHLYAQSLDASDDRFNTRDGVFYPSEFALLALPDREAASCRASYRRIRSQDSDADMSGKHRP